MLKQQEISMLIERAMEQRKFAYVPYSHFRVGAALLTKEGEVYTGSNIENASYGATNCAERTAFFKAVSEGRREFKAICIVGGDDKVDFCPPCGICRQVMVEFCDADFQVILAVNGEIYKIYSLAEILPLGFTLDSSDT